MQNPDNFQHTECAWTTVLSDLWCDQESTQQNGEARMRVVPLNTDEKHGEKHLSYTRADKSTLRCSPKELHFLFTIRCSETFANLQCSQHAGKNKTSRLCSTLRCNVRPCHESLDAPKWRSTSCQPVFSVLTSDLKKTSSEGDLGHFQTCQRACVTSTSRKIEHLFHGLKRVLDSL